MSYHKDIHHHFANLGGALVFADQIIHETKLSGNMAIGSCRIHLFNGLLNDGLCPVVQGGTCSTILHW